jgi:hypothetical protein
MDRKHSQNTEAIGLTYQVKNWDLGIFNLSYAPKALERVKTGAKEPFGDPENMG